MMKKKLLPLALMFVSVTGMAGEFSVTKTERPNAIFKSGVKAFSMHRLNNRDYPTGASMYMSQLVGISFSATSFPQSIGETAEICWKQQDASEDCIPITPGSSGYTNHFNSLTFGYASFMMIKHSQTGGPNRSSPIGSDSITFHVRY
jgi:hypothetical protein